MRLLITTDTIGGVWSFTGELSAELLRRGHAVHLVSFGRQPSPDQQQTLARLRETYPDHFEFTGSAIPLEWMGENERAYAEGEALLQRVLRGTATDLILANQLCFGHLDTPVPRIVVAHSDVLSWAGACRGSALEPSPWLHRYTAMAQAGLLQAAAVVVPTAWMGEALATNFQLPQGYRVIPNGVELSASTPDGHPSQPERKLQAVSAGRLWDEAKGLDVLAGCQLPMPVLVAGETQFDGQSSPPLPPDVHLLGQLSPADLQGVFRESAIYLCTSRYEPFGLAPVEAALCGCAVVARDLPSLREVWGEAALYFHDAAGLQTQLQRLADDPALLAAAQARSRRHAARYPLKRMVEGYLALFDSMLPKANVPPLGIVQQPEKASHVA